MARAVLAGFLGALVAVALAFLTVALISAVAGVPTMFDPDRVVYGWEGARYGVLLFAFLGGAMVWPFPAMALLGAAVGLLARQARRRGASVPSLRAPGGRAGLPGRAGRRRNRQGGDGGGGAQDRRGVTTSATAKGGTPFAAFSSVGKEQGDRPCTTNPTFHHR